MPERTDGALTRAQADELRERLRELQISENLSRRQLARALECSPATVSLILAGKYDRRNEQKYLLRAADWMRERAERIAAPDADFVETSAAANIWAVCQRAWSMPCIAKIVLPSGAGKTAALREFARRRGDRVRYFQAGEAAATKMGFIFQLAEVVQAAVGSHATVARLYRAARDKLAAYYLGGQRSPILLLVDEATTLNPACLNLLRNLHDDEAVRLAVVLADTDRLEGELHRRRGIAGGYAQLRSRLGAVHAPPAAEALTPADVDAVAASLARGLGHGGRLRADSLKFLRRVASAPGALRNVAHRLQAVRDVADAQDVEPTYSVAELDFVATLVGGQCELTHAASPFAAQTDAADPAPARARPQGARPQGARRAG